MKKLEMPIQINNPSKQFKIYNGLTLMDNEFLADKKSICEPEEKIKNVRVKDKKTGVKTTVKRMLKWYIIFF